MRQKALQLKYNGSAALRHSLWDPRRLHAEVYASAIVGGPRSVLLPALSSMAETYRAHWRSQPAARMVAGMDMILWNELALEARAQEWLVTGYPLGPVNLMPTWHPWAHSIPGLDKHNSTMFVNVTRGVYWFAHRPQYRWLHGLFAPWTVRCKRSEAYLLPAADSRALLCTTRSEVGY